MSRTSKATTVVLIQTALLAAAIAAPALSLAPFASTLLLVAAFGIGTALLIAKFEGGVQQQGAISDPSLVPVIARVDALGKGDLSAQLEITAGPLAPLASALNAAGTKLGELARNGHEAASSLAAAGGEIERSTQALSTGANRQVAAIAEVARRLQSLTLRCEEISQVVEVLDDLARQTNVLALNAALEASRAGPSGKGFAMVAEEVRKLAERSAAATKDVGAFVQTLESGAVEASRTLEEVQTLTKSLADGAGGTAAVSNELMNAAQGLTRTLSQLQYNAPVDDAVRKLLRGPTLDIGQLVSMLRPLVGDDATPLSRALTTLIRTYDEAKKVSANTSAATS
ncbi:MAG: methyl-accepting chemotaxis protein [Deltaproteobacteria bacterium]|nr:methyl-accepting chemotaxis protein [Deltaproteobacteria bacterium]